MKRNTFLKSLLAIVISPVIKFESVIKSTHFGKKDLVKYCGDEDKIWITKQISRYNRPFIKALDEKLSRTLNGI